MQRKSMEIERHLQNMQDSLPNQLNRTWNLEPVWFDDALGRITPIHMEFIDSLR